MTDTVWVQQWFEFDIGWERQDGVSIHLQREEVDKYVTGYNNEFNNERKTTFHEYSQAMGPPIKMDASELNPEELAKLSVLHEQEGWRKYGVRSDRLLQIRHVYYLK